MYTVDTVYLDCWFVVCNELPEVTNIWLSQRGMNYCRLQKKYELQKKDMDCRKKIRVAEKRYGLQKKQHINLLSETSDECWIKC